MCGAQIGISMGNDFDYTFIRYSQVFLDLFDESAVDPELTKHPCLVHCIRIDLDLLPCNGVRIKIPLEGEDNLIKVFVYEVGMIGTQALRSVTVERYNRDAFMNGLAMVR